VRTLRAIGVFCLFVRLALFFSDAALLRVVKIALTVTKIV
jgi:hypothetical protein